MFVADVHSEIFTQSDAATQFFCEGLHFSFVAIKKKGLHYISLTLSRNKRQLTLLFSLLHASWNVVAEKGRTRRRGKSWVVSGNLRNPSKTAPAAIHTICVHIATANIIIIVTEYGSYEH